MKLQFGIDINTLPDFLEGKTINLFGCEEDRRTVKVEVNSDEVIITRKKIRSSFLGTEITLKQPKEESKDREKHTFTPANPPRRK